MAPPSLAMGAAPLRFCCSRPERARLACPLAEAMPVQLARARPVPVGRGRERLVPRLHSFQLMLWAKRFVVVSGLPMARTLLCLALWLAYWLL